MIKTLNISLPQALINQVDLLSRRRSSSRSEFIRDSLRASIARSKLLDQAYAVGRTKAKKLGLKSETDAYNFLKR